jgi:hypothetical protein
MEKNDKNTAAYNQDTRDTIMTGLQGIDRYLAMINSRMEILMFADLPEYVMSDLTQVYQAEQEASQIVRSIKILCRTSL